jgi:hypothetical protein
VSAEDDVRSGLAALAADVLPRVEPSPCVVEGQPIPWLPQRPLWVPGEVEARRRLAGMPYDEYLLTAHWRHRRKRALALAGCRRERCARRSGLEVHHLSYDRRGFENDDDLIVLCDGCPEEAHTLAVELVRTWRRWVTTPPDDPGPRATRPEPYQAPARRRRSARSAAWS